MSKTIINLGFDNGTTVTSTGTITTLAVPASSIDNEVVLFSGTTGRSITGSGVHINTVVRDTSTHTLTNKTITSATNTIYANSLKTTGTAVNVSTSVPPSAGQALIAISPTVAAWTNPTAYFLDTTGAAVGISGAAPPTTGQVLTATSATAAAWSTPVAYSLKTTGANVVVSTAAAPTAGQTLTATSGTAAAWATPASGDVVGPASSTDNAVARFSAETGKIIQNSTAILSDAGDLSISSLSLPTTGATVGTLNINGVPWLHGYGSAINTFLGPNAGNKTLTSTSATGLGSSALAGLTTGAYNTGIGNSSLNVVNVGNRNTGLGYWAGKILTTGSDNTLVGETAGANFSTGSNNTFIGAGAGASATLASSNNIFIGANVGGVSGNGRIEIGLSGATYTYTIVAGIRGITTAAADAIPVLISSTGQLGTVSSSIRFKTDVQPLSAPGIIDGLRPVSFRYTCHDAACKLSIGLIAEEVAQVYPDMVIYQPNETTGVPEILTVDYARLPILLLAEVQKMKAALAAAGINY